MIKLSLNRKEINYDCISLILIFIGEVCFYTLDKIFLYLFITGVGVIIGLFHNRNRVYSKIEKDNFIIWVFIMFSIYFIYGFFFLQKGVFTWDTLGYRFIEIITLYLTMSNIFIYDIDLFKKAMIIVGVFSALYLIYLEGLNILGGGIRIGDSLSGNVNTVGYNFGIISTVIMWFFCREKKSYLIFFFLIFSMLMLLTGSKKVLIIILANLAMYFWFEKDKISGWLITIFILFVSLYLIFNVSYFYNIIGSRVEAMIETILLGSSSPIYSHSTEVREEMIKEALNLFLSKPFLGGGWNYFYAHTAYGYEYSHCNYTEMLCSFGILGTLLFYWRHFHDLKKAYKYRNSYISLYKDLFVLIYVVTFEALILDWATVSFSAQCVWYSSFILSAAAIKAIRETNKNIILR